MLFGRTACKLNMVRQEDVTHCLQVQEHERRSGAAPRSLGRILTDFGLITPVQFDLVKKEVLKASRDRNNLGPYELDDLLGEGGMGKVFRAHHVETGAEVALKVLTRKDAKSDHLSRFAREATIGLELKHPNIVRVIDVGQTDEACYIAMEVVDGGDLADWLDDNRVLSDSEAAAFMLPIAHALQYAHEQGLVHRDIKPSNIMFDSDGNVKLSDFGLVKARESEEGASLTQTGQTVGTPHYIAPEQAAGEKDIDIRADIYGLGATFYHLVTGQTPFEGDTAMVVMTKHLNDPLTPPREVNPKISEHCSAIVEKMMAKEAEDRYRTPKELADDLAAFLDGKPPVQALKRPRMRRRPVAGASPVMLGGRNPRRSEVLGSRSRSSERGLAPARRNTSAPRLAPGRRSAGGLASARADHSPLIGLSIVAGLMGLILIFMFGGDAAPEAQATRNAPPAALPLAEAKIEANPDEAEAQRPQAMAKPAHEPITEATPRIPDPEEGAPVGPSFAMLGKWEEFGRIVKNEANAWTIEFGRTEYVVDKKWGGMKPWDYSSAGASRDACIARCRARLETDKDDEEAAALVDIADAFQYRKPTDLPRACGLYLKVTREYPQVKSHYTRALYGLGQASQKLGRHADAIKAFETLLFDHATDLPADRLKQTREMLEKSRAEYEADRARARARSISEASSQGEWRALFDGRSLNGWEHIAPNEQGKATTQLGALVLKSGNELQRALPDANFELRGDVRFLRPSGGEWPSYGGIAVRKAGASRTDSIRLIFFSDGDVHAHDGHSKKYIGRAGEKQFKQGAWQTFTLRLDGRSLELEIEDKKVLATQVQTQRAGNLALFAARRDGTAHLEFRNLSYRLIDAAGDQKITTAWRSLLHIPQEKLLNGATARQWNLKNQQLVSASKPDVHAQTAISFTDGELRMRFNLVGGEFLSIGVRQGGGEGYFLCLNGQACSKLQKGIHEVIFRMDGASVRATLDGKAVDLRSDGTPQKGSLHISVQKGSMTITDLDYRMLPLH